MVGVCRDRELTTLRFRRSKQRPIDIKTLGTGVYLKPNASARRFSSDFLEVELVPFPMQQ